jgi:ribosomal-protein-alanine N-acetyltransferase
MGSELALESVVQDEPEVLVALDGACFERPWSAASWRDEIAASHTHQYFARGEGGEVVAYASISLVADEAEIRRIAVMPAHRRQGKGGEFLTLLLAALKRAGARRVFLEVRASNRAARSLYAAAGFSEDRVRAGYYRAPVEDGVDLSRSL